MKRCVTIACIAIAINSFAQDPAWDDDITVYGTAANESRPVITAMSQEDDTLRVFCVQDGYTVCNRVSLNNGLTWEPFTPMTEASDSQFIAATSNGDFTHALVFRHETDDRRLYSFDGIEAGWNSYVNVPAAFIGAFFEYGVLQSDYVFAGNDSYLNIGWLESSVTNDIAVCFCQSRDGGETVTTSHHYLERWMNESDPVGIAIATSWNGDSERIWLAHSTDRAGSVGNIVQLQFSDNQGEDWSELIALDSSSYPQIQPTIAAYAQTIMFTYCRRTGAPTQKDIFFLYSLDNGEHFSEPTPITGGLTDEFDPQVVISPDGESFAIFYLSGAPLEEPCTVLMRSGSLETPWDLSEVQQVSTTEGALRAGGVSATATSNGFAAVWSSPHALGDADILFDGSWRGAAVDNQPVISVVNSFMLPAYPNPFNSMTTIPLMIRNESEVELTVNDILGRRVATKQIGHLSPGRNEIQMDVSGVPSGAYWISSKQLSNQQVKVVLIK